MLGPSHANNLSKAQTIMTGAAADRFNRRKARGGKPIYGAAVGILMLEARFPRIVGDMGNAATWDFPVLYKVVRGATPDLVVRRGAAGMTEAFVAAAKELVVLGARGITTNCGFLSVLQRELAAQCGVPVLASSLMQAEVIQKLLPVGQTVGILTISKQTLSAEHLRAANVPDGTPVVGTDGGREFSRVILNDEEEMDVELARLDLLDAAARLADEHPEVGAILLECTNMSPYSADIRHLTKRPVFDIYNFVSWFHGALAPRAFLDPPPFD
jgi:Asp/Glu/hydantoin racemase